MVSRLPSGCLNPGKACWGLSQGYGLSGRPWNGSGVCRAPGKSGTWVTVSPLAALSPPEERQPIQGEAGVPPDEPSAWPGAKLRTQVLGGPQESLPLSGETQLPAQTQEAAAVASVRERASREDVQRGLGLPLRRAAPKAELAAGPAPVPSGYLGMNAWPLLLEEEPPSPSSSLVFARALELSSRRRTAPWGRRRSPSPQVVPSRGAGLSSHTKVLECEPPSSPFPAPAGDPELTLDPDPGKAHLPAAPAPVRAAHPELSMGPAPLHGGTAVGCPSGPCPVPPSQPCPPPACSLTTLIFFTLVIYSIFILRELM